MDQSSERPTAYPSARDDIGAIDVGDLERLTRPNLADLRIARAQARAAWHAASEREHAAFDAWHAGATTTAALDFAAARADLNRADEALAAASLALRAARGARVTS